MTATNIIVGELGEKLAFNRLRNLGRVRIPQRKLVGDIHLDGLRIEVKAARPSKVNATKTGWQFCLRRSGHTDISNSHILILIGLSDCGDPQKVYIIPVSALRADRRKISIVIGSPTKWAHWENRFDVIESALIELEQKTMDGFDFDAVKEIAF